jgi:hypothetical protein
MSDTPETTTNETTPPVEKTSKRQMSFSVLDTGEIRADFGPELEPLVLNPASVPETLQAAAVVEGLISRLRGYTSKLTDETRTPENLRSAIAKGIESLLAGVWKIERAAGEGVEFSLEVQAAFLFRRMRAEAKGETFTGTLEEASVNFAALTDEQKKALKALPRYQLALAQVKAEHAAKKAEKLAKKVSENEDDAGF